MCGGGLEVRVEGYKLRTSHCRYPFVAVSPEQQGSVIIQHCAIKCLSNFQPGFRFPTLLKGQEVTSGFYLGSRSFISAPKCPQSLTLISSCHKRGKSVMVSFGIQSQLGCVGGEEKCVFLVIEK